MRPLIKFFLFTFIVSWSLWIAAAAILGGTFSPSLTAPPSPVAWTSGLLYVIGVFAPALVGLGLTFWEEGRAATMALLCRTMKSREALRWYMFAVGYFVSIKFVGVIIYRLSTGAWPAFSQESWYIMAAAIVFSTPAARGLADRSTLVDLRRLFSPANARRDLAAGAAIG